jgi:hypothetical protein
VYCVVDLGRHVMSESYWRLGALGALGDAPLVPWFVLHAAGGHLAAWQLTATLFVLPLVALLFGMAAVHVLLWRGRGFSVFGLLVIVSCFCLVGSVVGSAVEASTYAPAGTHDLARSAR